MMMWLLGATLLLGSSILQVQSTTGYPTSSPTGTYVSCVTLDIPVKSSDLPTTTMQSLLPLVVPDVIPFITFSKVHVRTASNGYYCNADHWVNNTYPKSSSTNVIADLVYGTTFELSYRHTLLRFAV